MLRAILPLKAQTEYSDENLDRARLLFRSLELFYPHLISKTTIVVPSIEVKPVRDAFAGMGASVVAEESFVPEFSSHQFGDGYRKQMIIKLVAALRFDTDFCLTLDSDLICLRKCTDGVLIQSGKALMQPCKNDEPPNHYPWFEDSSRLLKLRTKRGSLAGSVTPAILAKSVVRLLKNKLETLYEKPWVEVLLQASDTRFFRRLPFLRRYHWSEYSLYQLVAQESQLLNSVHKPCEGNASAPNLISSASLWWAEDLKNWSAAKCFESTESALFCVAQSNTGVAADRIEREFEPYL